MWSDHSIALDFVRRMLYYDCMNNIHDWAEIQRYYDAGNTWRAISDKFGCAQKTIANAVKQGKFKSRSRSVAIKAYQVANPDKLKHSAETKAKISKIRIAYLTAHPDKVPYLLNHASKASYPESYFAEVFKQEKLDVVQEFKVGLFSLDFALPERKIDIEIDGEQHYVDKTIIVHDIKRTAALEELGWKAYRIRWAEYQKLTFDEKKNFVKEFLEKVLA